MTAPKPEVLPDDSPEVIRAKLGSALSDADCDKILAGLKIKVAKPRTVHKYKAMWKAAITLAGERLEQVQSLSSELDQRNRERDAGLVALTKMEAKSARHLKMAIWGWLFAVALLIARAFGK